MDSEEALLKIPTPSSILLSGPSGSGKTMLIYEILKQAKGIFAVPPSQIIYCYGIYQNLYDKIKANIDNIQFFKGLPSKENLEAWSTKNDHSVLILDDLMAKCSVSQDTCDLFTIYSHHIKFTVFYLAQNLFSGGKQFRTISLNTHQFVFFKNQRDELQMKNFAMQVFPDDVKFFMSAYKKATATRYGYLFLDLSPSTTEEETLYKLRTNILPGEKTIVYLPCDKAFFERSSLYRASP